MAMPLLHQPYRLLYPHAHFARNQSKIIKRCTYLHPLQILVHISAPPIFLKGNLIFLVRNKRMAAPAATVEKLRAFVDAERTKMVASVVAFAINMVDMLCSSTESPEAVYKALSTINSLVMALGPKESAELRELESEFSRCFMALMHKVDGLNAEIMALTKHNFDPRKFFGHRTFTDAMIAVVVAYPPGEDDIKKWIDALSENHLYAEMQDHDTYLYALELLKSIEGGHVRGNPWRKKLDDAHNKGKEPNPKRSRAK